MAETKRLDPQKEMLKKVKKQFTGWCPTCHKECRLISQEDMKKKKAKRITGKSAKQKARRAQQAVAAMIQEAFGLEPEDVKSVTMGTSGQDIELSAKARGVWPFHAIEVTANLNASVWAKFAQARKHAEKQLSGKVPGNGKPILIFKKNGTALFAMVLFDDIISALQDKGRQLGEKRGTA
jgi:hypothetical protein